MTDTIMMEELSKTYLLTIATGSGYFNSNASYDYGTDLTIRKANYSPERKRVLTSGKSIDIQVKAVSEKYTQGLIDDNSDIIKYTLEIKNYNDLVDRANENGVYMPLILCVFIIPDDKNDWYSITPTELTIRKCAFWFQVPAGTQKSKNTTNITISIPKENLVCKEFYNKIWATLT